MRDLEDILVNTENNVITGVFSTLPSEFFSKNVFVSHHKIGMQKGTQIFDIKESFNPFFQELHPIRKYIYTRFETNLVI